MDAYEQVAQMGDEPADVDAVLIKRDAVGLLDDGQHLLDDAGHLVCVGQVAVREAGVDQMQRQCHGLAAGQDTVQVTVEFIDQPRGLRVLGRVQRLDFRLQRICDVDVALRLCTAPVMWSASAMTSVGCDSACSASPVAVMRPSPVE